MIQESHSPDPAVSIIIPAYNLEQFIAGALESVLAQTFTDFEALVVDDGSKDRTRAIAQQFAARDRRVHVLSQSNQGVSAARNHAMARARGQFFALLDGDDMWKPEYLAEQLRILQEVQPGADVVSANAVNVGGRFDGLLWKDTTDGLHPVSLMDLIAVEDSVCIMSVFRRTVFERVGDFDTTLKGSEDYDFWLRTAALGFTIVLNGTPLGYYRRRPDSMSADEGTMLAAVQEPLKKLRHLVRPSSPEAAAIDAQLRRFERERLLHQAKNALVARDFEAARHHFRTLAGLAGTLRSRVLARVGTRAPWLLAHAYATRRAARRWLRRPSTA